jgi:hypothetical protein
VTGLGDVNGDEFDDFAVSAFRNDTGGPDAGRVYVFLGGSGPFPEVLVAADAYYDLTGDATYDRFGTEIASVADVDGDGIRELLIGAHFSDLGGGNSGAAYLFSGASGDPIHIWPGESSGDRFGITLADAGDTDGDGVTDVIIGADLNDAGGTDAGRAYVYSGDTGLLLYRITGAWPNDWLGLRVAGVGDLDDDGKDDWIAGAPGSDADGPGSGRAYVVLGRPGPYPVEINGADANLILTGQEPGDEFGMSLCAVDDVDGDGLPDIAVGAASGSVPGKASTGEVLFLSGQSGELRRVFSGDAPDDDFGVWMHCDADIDHDGTRDLIVGAMYNDTAAPNAGRAYVYLLGDEDADGLTPTCDNCPQGHNPDQQPTVFGQEILADDLNTFSWEEPVDVSWVRGNLATVSVYGTHAGDDLRRADMLVDENVPDAGEGYYYLVKLGGSCAVGSWQSSTDAEPARDAALP